MTESEAIETLIGIRLVSGYSKSREEALDMAIAALKKQEGKKPITVETNIYAADVRPVVRCRDCELWNDWDSAGKESLGNYVCSCAHWSVEDGAVLYTRPTDYCSYGERKGGDE